MGDEVKIKGTYMVKGVGSSWRGTMKLGEWDQLASMVYVPTLYLYSPPQTGEWTTSKMVETLKESLGQALFDFYPFAGRIHRGPGGTTELVCENQGAEVIEAESSSKLGISVSSSSRGLIPVIDTGNRPVEELPLLCVQLTRFRCGGVSIGLVANHGVCDGMAAFHFVTEWAGIARGRPLHTPPIHDRTLLRAGEPPKGLGFPDQGVSRENIFCAPPDPEPTSMITLPLSKPQMDKLKSLANESNTSRGFTRYEVLTAHTWRCVCNANGDEGEEPKAVAITLDARSRVSPTLPREYFGNAVVMVAARSKAGELIHHPLGYACRRIRETIEKVKDWYVQTDIDHLKRVGPMEAWHLGVRNPVDLSLAGMPEVGVISWLTLPLDAIDFGWGNYLHISPGPTVFPGMTNLLPGKAGDGSVEVVICLQTHHVAKFKAFFYHTLV